MIKECWQFNYLFDLNFLMLVIIKHLINLNKSITKLIGHLGAH